MSSDKPQWPEALKSFVGRCFQEADDSNRLNVESALKELISKHYKQGDIWTTDWNAIGMEALAPFLDQEQQKVVIPLDKKRKAANNELGKPKDEKSTDNDKLDKRRKRFEAEFQNFQRKNVRSKNDDQNQLGPIIGKSTQLEKRYLRLTSAPDPNTVRPLPILKRTLELLKSKWKSEKNYAYICDQFKSMRQDLTVQHIQNEFTVQVYEIHARIALEKADVGEYNQCQSQLMNLYNLGIPGKTNEFLAYRILYNLYTKNTSELNTILATLTEEEKQHEAVQHALQVREALASTDYYTFFQLYLITPNMGGYLLDLFIERERVNALSIMCKAYRPSLDTTFVANMLAFEDMDEFKTFISSCNVVYDAKQPDHILMRDSMDSVERRKKKFSVVDIKGQI